MVGGMTEVPDLRTATRAELLALIAAQHRTITQQQATIATLEHQRCWVHLLRDIHDLRVLYPQVRGVARWATAVRKVYDRATACASDDPRERGRMRGRCEQALGQVCRTPAADPTAVQGRLSRRILRHLSELFVFVARPEVPADTNGTERSVRHLVTSRTISGGTRSPAGTATKMTLATLFGTWRLQGRDPFLACCETLVSPRV